MTFRHFLKNPCWNYVEGYIDEGLSATTTKRRESFHRMVEDGKAGKFDFIVTKYVTTVRTKRYIRASRTACGHNIAATHQCRLGL